MDKIDFLKESIKNLKTVGTITRSSKFLCKKMIRPVNFSQADTIVELGAGDGVITKHIVKSMKKDAKLLTFEVNESFCNIMRDEIKDDRVHIIEDSAERLEHYLGKVGAKQIDYVISAIPFVVVPDEVALDIVSTCKKFLKPGGLYIQVHYSLLEKKLYQKVFGNVDINFVPLNLPPAFVLVSEKR